jgi:hypothetical protein
MSTTLLTSLSDFTSAVDRLEANGSNWVIFQHQFTIAVQQKKVWSQFDGTAPKPPDVPTSPVATEATAAATDQKKKLDDWNERETLAKYLLTQKLPDLIFTKYVRKNTVAEIWSGLSAGNGIHAEEHDNEVQLTFGIHGFAIVYLDFYTYDPDPYPL